MSKTEFEKKLYSTVIPSISQKNEREAKITLLNDCAKLIMPAALFRYRKCDSRSIDAFKSDKVWVSIANCMNDGFDSRLYFDKKSILEWKKGITSTENFESILSLLTNKTTLPSPLAAYQQIAQMYEIATNLPFGELKKNLMLFRDSLNLSIDKMTETLNEVSQHTFKLCCLSEKIDSPVMWGLYAVNETGFALAYDCRNIYSDISKENGIQWDCWCYPIIYKEQRFEVPIDYVQYLIMYNLLKDSISSHVPHIANGQALLDTLQCPDELIPMKIALHKYQEWSYEDEWRIICMVHDNSSFREEYHSCFTLKPSALYLGRKIERNDESILKEIAKAKEIPVYKMHLDDDSATYRLFAKNISSDIC